MQRRLIGELGRPSRTRDRGRWKRSMSWYKATPKSRAVRRESERVVVLRTLEPVAYSTTHESNPLRSLMVVESGGRFRALEW
jgi:hypothetical protein